MVFKTKRRLFSLLETTYDDELQTLVRQKLRFVFAYFSSVTSHMPTGIVSFRRVSLGTFLDKDLWEKLTKDARVFILWLKSWIVTVINERFIEFLEKIIFYIKIGTFLALNLSPVFYTFYAPNLVLDTTTSLFFNFLPRFVFQISECRLHVAIGQKIEDQTNHIQMDFANKMIGGGTLTKKGSAQVRMLRNALFFL